MVLDSSFNNLSALNNSLNHSPILSNNNVSVSVLSIQDFLSHNNLTFTDFLNNWNFLNNNVVDIDAIIGVLVLPIGTILVI